MRSESTIRKRLSELRAAVAVLPIRESDQAYGAAEALRWVLGGPSLTAFMKPFEQPKQGGSETNENTV